MKKRICAYLLLCAAFLGITCPAAATVGGGDDPLVSLSYLNERFLPGLPAALREFAAGVTADFEIPAGTRPGLKTLSLVDGDSVFLTEGQQLVLLSGGARLEVTSGSAVNATAGRTTTGGELRLANRYVLCGGSGATVTAVGDVLLRVSSNAVSTQCPFLDIARGDWFFNDVAAAYQKGLINGVTDASYEPQSTLTWAQAIKLAACMHQLYHDGAVTLTPGEGSWYTPYANYARSNKILTRESVSYNANITRGEFLQLFYNTLPEREYPRKNTIMDGSIPDVATDAPLARQVYTFYAAGILTGYAATDTVLEHSFGAETTISRAEVATIMNRMLTPSARVTFTME